MNWFSFSQGAASCEVELLWRCLLGIVKQDPLQKELEYTNMCGIMQQTSTVSRKLFLEGSLTARASDEGSVLGGGAL